MINKNPGFTIGDKKIGGDNPCFIIAEAGINHNGDVSTAKKMIDLAVDCGVDSIKFQTFTAREFISDEKITYKYKSQGKEVEESVLKMFERNEFKENQWKEIADYCKAKGIIFFSTPKNVSNLELLLKIGVPAIKVSSANLVNLPILREYSKKKLPMIISTGMAYLSEVDEAVRIIKENNNELAVLHCVSSYPTAFENLNLKKIITLKSAFPDCVIGYSDHTEGSTAGILAVATGAKILEKHFTLDKNMPGPDHWFSADPNELRELVRGVRNAEKSFGSSEIKPTDDEKKMRLASHCSIVADKDIKKGEIITQEIIAIKRPGTGLLPKFLPFVIGRMAKEDIKKGELIILEKLG